MYLLFVSFWTISPSKLVGGNAANQCHLLINRGNFDKGQLVTVITNNWREQKINNFPIISPKVEKLKWNHVSRFSNFHFHSTIHLNNWTRAKTGLKQCSVWCMARIRNICLVVTAYSIIRAQVPSWSPPARRRSSSGSRARWWAWCRRRGDTACGSST